MSISITGHSCLIIPVSYTHLGHGLSPQEIFLLRFLIAYMGIWLISPRKLFAYNWKY